MNGWGSHCLIVVGRTNDGEMDQRMDRVINSIQSEPACSTAPHSSTATQRDAMQLSDIMRAHDPCACIIPESATSILHACSVRTCITARMVLMIPLTHIVGADGILGRGMTREGQNKEEEREMMVWDGKSTCLLGCSLLGSCLLLGCHFLGFLLGRTLAQHMLHNLLLLNQEGAHDTGRHAT